MKKRAAGTKASEARRKQPKRQERGRKKIEEIIKIASRHFAAHGFDGTSMLGIARDAGMSMGSLYQYFPNKEALVAAVAEHFKTRWMDFRNELPAKNLKTLREYAFVGVEGLVDFFRRNLGIKAFFDSNPHRAKTIRSLETQVDNACLIFSRFYLTQTRAEFEPVGLMATFIVESMAIRIAGERSKEKRAALVLELTDTVMAYVESKLGPSE